MDKAISAIEFRINQINQALEIADKLPPAIVQEYENRLDELETLLHYLRVTV